jgi:hypothetical protein
MVCTGRDSLTTSGSVRAPLALLRAGAFARPPRPRKPGSGASRDTFARESSSRDTPATGSWIWITVRGVCPAVCPAAGLRQPLQVGQRQVVDPEVGLRTLSHRAAVLFEARALNRGRRAAKPLERWRRHGYLCTGSRPCGGALRTNVGSYSDGKPAQRAVVEYAVTRPEPSIARERRW